MAARIARQLPSAKVRHRCRFGLLGQPLVVESNDARVIEIAASSFGRFPAVEDGAPLVVRLVVERERGVPIDELAEGLASDRNGAGGQAPKAAAAGGRFDEMAYRVSGSTVLITGRDHDVAALDVAAGRGVGHVGEAALADPRGLRYAFLEAMAYWLVAYTRGYVTLHASGIARDGIGLVLEGPAGAGKTTLAVAAARRGMSVFAEDAVFARLAPGGMELWGTPWIQRLLPESRALFPELGALAEVAQPNGERKIEVDLDEWFPGAASPMASPGAIVSVSRAPGGPTGLVPVDPSDDRPELLWPYDLDWLPAHQAVEAALGRLPAFRLRVGGSPDEAIDALVALFDELRAAPAGARR